MESALPQPTSFSEQVLSMTSFPPAYLFTVAITSITLLAISGASPAPLAIENARRRTGNALRATTDSERIIAERELRRELMLSLQRRTPRKRSKTISTSTPLSISAPAPSKCCAQNPRYETTQRLRKALDSANSAKSENAFAAFRDRLLLSNKIWAQERELKGIKGDKVPISDIAKPKVETRDAEVQAMLEEDTEKLGVDEKVLALVQSIADDLTASQREVLALQSQLARYDQTMGEEYNEWVGENERLRAELDGFKERAGVTATPGASTQAAVLDDEYSEVGHSSEEGDGLDQTMVVDESFGRPIPLYTHLEGAEEDFDDTDSLDGHSDSGSDSSTSTIAEFDGDYLIDEDEDYFSSARKMYSLENSKASPSPTTGFQPFPSKTVSPIPSPLSSPKQTPSKLPRRPSRRRHHSLHNPNPVFILSTEPPTPMTLKTLGSSDDVPIQRKVSNGKLKVMERVRKISGSLGAVVTGKNRKLGSDASFSDNSAKLPPKAPLVS